MLRPFFETAINRVRISPLVGSNFSEGRFRACPPRKMQDASPATSCQAALHGCLPADKPRSKSSPQGDREMRQAVHTWRQTRCGPRFLACSRTLFVSLEHLAVVLRSPRCFFVVAGLWTRPKETPFFSNLGLEKTEGETHGTRKTRHQAPGTAQEVPQEDKRLFPHQEQALPIRTGSRQSRRSLRQARPPRQEAPVPPPMDSARRRRRPPERLDLRPVDSRPQGRRRHARPQSASGYRGKGRRGIHVASGNSESRCPATSQGKKVLGARRQLFVGAQHAAPHLGRM